MMIGIVDISTGPAPKFGLLNDILVYDKEPKVLFIFKVMKTLGFDPKFGAYVVCSTVEYLCVHQPALPCHHRLNVVTINGCKYIKSKYDLSVYCNF